MKLFILIFLNLSFHISDNEIPPTNAKIIEYINSVKGKKVDRGECWDLANGALTYAHAKWESPYGFGKPIDYKTEKIIPGDIIHILNVTMESRSENSITRWKMVEHTAILHELKEANKVMVAEQNVNGVRKVQINEWNLDDVKSGKLQFFRPQAE
jgi:hypothetical protein